MAPTPNLVEIFKRQAAKDKTPAQALGSLVRAGIMTPDGKMAKPFRSLSVKPQAKR